MFYVYVLASKPYGTLYVGVTSDLARRVWEHKNKLVPGFTKRYGVARLVWFETHDSVEGAIQREKRIKEWKRDWKLNLNLSGIIRAESIFTRASRADRASSAIGTGLRRCDNLVIGSAEQWP
jgi:putative endonuclease